jgi:hypothetical protein
MAEITDIRTSMPLKIDTETVDRALNAQACDLFEAMAIVRLASRQAARCADGSGDLYERGDIWAALNGAHKLLGLVADRLESTEMLLATEVPRGKY